MRVQQRGNPPRLYSQEEKGGGEEEKNERKTSSKDLGQKSRFSSFTSWTNGILYLHIPYVEVEQTFLKSFLPSHRDLLRKKKKRTHLFHGMTVA